MSSPTTTEIDLARARTAMIHFRNCPPSQVHATSVVDPTEWQALEILIAEAYASERARLRKTELLYPLAQPVVPVSDEKLETFIEEYAEQLENDGQPKLPGMAAGFRAGVRKLEATWGVK